MALPTLAATFGIMPWDVERLTDGEVTVFLQALADAEKARQQAERRAAGGS